MVTRGDSLLLVLQREPVPQDSEAAEVCGGPHVNDAIADIAGQRTVPFGDGTLFFK